MESRMGLPISLRPRPYLLANKIQHYAWGSRGPDALIPRLLGVAPKPNVPYAELWIGTHPKAPSEIILDGTPVPLPRVISECPLQILGERVSRRFSGTLPFLLKVLSVAGPLSIQVHPNREQAQALSARDPEHYPDNNHKPELAVALDSLTALVGFRSQDGILRALENHPELAHFIGLDVFHRLKTTRGAGGPEQGDLTRLVYERLVQRSTMSRSALMEVVGQLESRLRRSMSSLRQEEQLFLDLTETHSGADAGLLSVFLLNPIHLQEGQGVFIEPGIPHAYLKGNIVECMANSDNVVRAGLTSKFTDFGTMVEILDYGVSAIPILPGDPDQEHVIYQTAAAEFQIGRWRLRQGRTITEVTGGKPEIFLVTQGQISVTWRTDSEITEAAFHEGQSMLIPASLAELEITSLSGVELFEAEVPLR
jgi:mannose-6-phosphate isomerase